VSRAPREVDFNHYIPTAFNTVVRDDLLLDIGVGSAATQEGCRPALASEPLVDRTAIVSLSGLLGACKRP
jgi:hypothetical protein